MKLLRRSLAALAICTATVALAAPPACAAITLVNAGFETGNATGWHGSGSVTQGYAGYTAPDGSYFGLVRSPGCPGESLEQQFTAQAGDVLTGWAFFRTGDYLPYDDNGDVRLVIERSNTSTVVFSSSVGEVGAAGATPWTPFSYAFESDGSYVVQVRVANAVDCGEESAVGIDMAQGPTDRDGDAVTDDADNCPDVENPDQLNQDGDKEGDACDADDDNDVVDDVTDNCDVVANTEQSDNDGDRRGDACDADDDNDSVEDSRDNCPTLANPGQRDDDRDGTGNACDEAFDSTAGRATGGGAIRHDGYRLSYSVSARSKRGVLHGACTITFRRTKITCLNVDGYAQDANDTQVVIVGDAVIDGTLARYRIVLRDGDEERFRITTASGFVAGGLVVRGKIRVRQG